jgi:hypothetical protein
MPWPGERGCAERLADVVAAVRREPPPVHRGDLLTDVPSLARRAPATSTLVIYHAAVLACVTEPQRWQFARTVRGLGAAWLSNEGSRVLPGISTQPHDGRQFLQVFDGTTSIAFTDPHGTWLQWVA